MSELPSDRAYRESAISAAIVTTVDLEAGHKAGRLFEIKSYLYAIRLNNFYYCN